jgi:hypothetical protein
MGIPAPALLPDAFSGIAGGNSVIRPLMLSATFYFRIGLPKNPSPFFGRCS